ncbi:MAG: hypothetical protein QM658_04870 [Gordonia sp. (in: high G+C Gram-positive bacteria)]
MPEQSSGPARGLRVARGTGHVCWWLFVLSALFAVLSLGPSGPMRYADYRPDFGWTAYTPLTDSSPALSAASSNFTAVNFFATLALVAVAITVCAAVAEAVFGRRLWTGVVTVVAPVVGGLLIAIVHNGGVGSMYFRIEILFALAVLGVAIREVWSRALAPTRG